MPTCHLQGVDLFYAEKGQGEPLVFLNGLSGDHLYWMGQLRTFSKEYRCLAVDHRDVGQSSYASAPYTVKDLALDVAGLLQELKLPPAHVVGLSMGGMVALELALAAPERVRSLIVAGTPARADEWYRTTLGAFELIRRQVPDTAAFFEAIMPWWVSYRFFEQPGRVAWLRWLIHQSPHGQQLDGFLRQMQAIQQHDVLDRLGLVRCPVLVMTGEDDGVAPPRYADELAKGLARAEVAILPGVGHAPPIEDPRQFNEKVADFLAAQRKRRQQAS